MITKRLGMLGVALVLGGCGGTNDDVPAGTPNTEGTATATVNGMGGGSTTTNTATSASTTGGLGGAATTGSSVSTTGQLNTPDCSGAFAEPTMLFEGTAQGIPQSFSITPDELQLYYVMDTLDDRYIERRVRSNRTAAFGAAEAVAELVDVCTPLGGDLHVGSVDLSPDGLGAYISCELDVTQPTTVIYASRPQLSEPFAVDTTSLGTVGASFATADGFEGYANTPDLFDRVERYQRASLDSAFAAAEVLDFNLRSPDPSNDGLFLFGSVLVDPVAGTDYQLAVARRASTSEPYGEPSSVGFPVPPAGYSDSTVTVSADCRTVYFLRYSSVDGVFSAVSSTRQ